MRGWFRGDKVALLSIGIAVAIGSASCGSQGQDGVGTPEPPPPSTQAPSLPESTAQAPSRKVPPMPPGAGRDKRHTIKGTLAEAVEPGCVVLHTAQGNYVLLGTPTKLRQLEPGTAVVARGTVAKSVATTCQQGTPFRVDTARPA